jgi:transcriptional regulatory protein RtcR
MTDNKPIVVLGYLGSQLDAGVGLARWNRWRPTVSLFDRDDVPFVRFEMLYSTAHRRLADQVAADVHKLAPEVDVCLHEMNFEDPWNFEEVYATLHDFVRSYPFRPEEETYWVHLTTGTHVFQICLFLMIESRAIPGVVVQTSPSRDRSAPLSLIDLDLAAYDRLRSRFESRRQEAAGLLKAGIVTRSAVFNRIIDRIERVVTTSTWPILLTGPTGAGKTQLARRIHALRRSRHLVAGELVEVNCATLRGDAAMSTLFGHVRGAFTGALSDRPGLLRQAHQGSLFLDEVGELGLDEQAMLLRAIEDRRFRPLGADAEVESDFQLIVGNNRDLSVAVAEGRFREDLLARINAWTFRLPGLAQRSEDIEPNLDVEVEREAERTGRRVRFNRQARARFLRFAVAPDAAWTGNFRDLNAAVHRMSTLAPAGIIDEDTVADEEERLREAWSGADRVPSAGLVSQVMGEDRAATLDRFDRVQLEDVIAVCRTSRSLAEAGRVLFAASREQRASVNDSDRLRKYLARFELTWDAVSAKSE